MVGNDYFWNGKSCFDNGHISFECFWWQSSCQSVFGGCQDVSKFGKVRCHFVPSQWLINPPEDTTSPETSSNSRLLCLPQRTSLPVSISVVLGMSGKRRPKPWDGDHQEDWARASLTDGSSTRDMLRSWRFRFWGMRLGLLVLDDWWGMSYTILGHSRRLSKGRCAADPPSSPRFTNQWRGDLTGVLIWTNKKAWRLKT